MVKARSTLRPSGCLWCDLEEKMRLRGTRWQRCPKAVPLWDKLVTKELLVKESDKSLVSDTQGDRTELERCGKCHCVHGKGSFRRKIVDARITGRAAQLAAAVGGKSEEATEQC